MIHRAQQKRLLSSTVHPPEINSASCELLCEVVLVVIQLADLPNKVTTMPVETIP